VIGCTFGYTDVPIAELNPDHLIDHMRELPAAVAALGPSLKVGGRALSRAPRRARLHLFSFKSAQPRPGPAALHNCESPAAPHVRRWPISGIRGGSRFNLLLRIRLTAVAPLF